MEIERCSNEKCHRPFQVMEYKLQMPGTKEREDISCPHCGHTTTQISNGFFRTSALSPEQETEFNKSHPI